LKRYGNQNILEKIHVEEEKGQYQKIIDGKNPSEKKRKKTHICVIRIIYMMTEGKKEISHI
jgi:hypothetical protein